MFAAFRGAYLPRLPRAAFLHTFRAVREDAKAMKPLGTVAKIAKRKPAKAGGVIGDMGPVPDLENHGQGGGAGSKAETKSPLTLKLPPRKSRQWYVFAFLCLGGASLLAQKRKDANAEWLGQRQKLEEELAELDRKGQQMDANLAAGPQHVAGAQGCIVQAASEHCDDPPARRTEVERLVADAVVNTPQAAIRLPSSIGGGLLPSLPSPAKAQSVRDFDDLAGSSGVGSVKAGSGLDIAAGNSISNEDLCDC